MKNKTFVLFSIILSVLLALSACAEAYAQQKHGNVIRAIDGDTVKFRYSDGKNKTIRLYGIDAPEMKQVFGLEARNFLFAITKGKELNVQSFGDDLYKREIAILSLPNENSINQQMVEAGFAWQYLATGQNYLTFSFVQQSAINGGLGLWSMPNPVEPKIFRKDCKN